MYRFVFLCFWQIDDDFIAQYQMNYGASESSQQAQPDANQEQTTPGNDSQDNYQKYWDYYNQYYKQGGKAEEEEKNIDRGKEILEAENCDDHSGLPSPPFDTNSEEYRKWYIEYCKYYYGYDYSEYYGVPEEEEDNEEGQDDKGQQEENNTKGKKKGKRKFANPKPPEGECVFVISF